MNKEQVFEIVKKIINEKGFDEEINLESVFTDDLGIDSLDLVDITMDCDAEFKTNISDEELEKTHTVNDLLNIICRKLEIEL